jgi:hypothetical protein
MIIGPPMYKEAAEIWDWAVSFEDELVATQTITSATFKAVLEADDSDATTAMKQGSETILAGDVLPASVVSQVVKAGTAGKSYLLQLTANDSLGRIFVAERRLIIKDPLPVNAP